ncbi:MAG: hypothetical protein PHG61_07270 [Candidatus Marinimicrobia bacterium]|nr:hypothetical protein [Candidatus Neomarinimicrobiota bacterium]
MTVYEIVREYLVTHGADGLAGEGCGCGVEDGLFPCECFPFDCMPAIKHKATEEDAEEYDCDVGDDIYISISHSDRRGVDRDSNKQSEIEKLREAMNHFTVKMLKKLESKVFEGWFGWNERENIESIHERLKYNLEQGDWVDVANLAMMLDRFKEKENKNAAKN